MYLATKPPVALDQARAALVIGGDDLAHILGIEPSRHRCRTDEIAEHHRQLTALGGSVGGKVETDRIRYSRRLGECPRKLSDGRQ